MTDNFIPIVSTTPPPIDDRDFDDDFTDFAQATNSLGSDDDFGDFSAPPPLSDDSFGSPLKSVHHQPLETQFSPIVDNIVVQNEMLYDIKGNDANSNITTQVNDIIDNERGTKPSHDNAVTNDISVSTNGTTFLNGTADQNSYFKEQPSDFESSVSNDLNLELKNSVDTSEKFTNPITAEFENDDTESFPKNDDCSLSQNGKLSDQSPPTNESFYENEIVSDADDDVTYRSHSTQNVNTCLVVEHKDSLAFDGVIETDATSSTSSRTSPVQNDSTTEQDLIPDDTKLKSDAKVISLPLTDSSSNDGVDKDTVGAVEKSNCEDSSQPMDEDGDAIAGHDASQADTLGAEKEIEGSYFEASVPFSNPSDDSASFANFASFNQTGSNSEFMDATFPVSSNNVSDSMVDEESAVHLDSSTVESLNDDKQNSQPSATLKEDTFSEMNEEIVDDDFADFASFDVPLAIKKPEVSFPTDTAEDKNSATDSDKFENNEDEFADNDDDFGAFTDNGFVSAAPVNDNDAFGDFGSGSHDIAFAQSEPFRTATNDVTESISKIPRWFPQCEMTPPPTSGRLDDEVNLIHSHVEENIIPLLSCDSSTNTTVLGPKKLFQSPTQLWELLEDVDNAIALRFKWDNSSNHEQLLTSLGISTKNIVFSGTSAPMYVPSYATGLGLLQPETGPSKPMSAADKITAASPTEKSPKVDATLTWTIETDGAAHSRSHSNGADAGSLSSASGCDAISLDFAALDVSTSKSSKSPPEQDRMDPELLEFAMSVTPDVAPAKRSDPLSKILASLKTSSGKKVEDKEELSPDAAKIISDLPDLSYMRSHVLMFPVRGPTSVSNS